MIAELRKARLDLEDEDARVRHAARMLLLTAGTLAAHMLVAVLLAVVIVLVA